MPTENSPKNIVYIMLDDADYYDFAYQALSLDDPDAVTPNIDNLRAGGMAFTNFYSGSSVCTPTRVSVLTGDNPLAYGATHVWPQIENVVQGSASINGIGGDAPQLGRMMQDLGMATGHFGKWHVGASVEEYRHAALGFDSWAYFNKSPDDDSYDDRAGITDFYTDHGDYTLDVDDVDIQFTNEIIDFIEASAAADAPFYLNFWPLTPHTPLAVPRGFDNSETQFDLSTDRGKLLAMMYMIDGQIGRIVDTLRDAGELDDTLIVVTSDNGGLSRVQTEDTDLRGGKGSLWEGGIKVPMLAFWPNGIEAGTVNESVMTTADLLPTFLDLLGEDPTGLYEDISGRSFADAFTDSADLDHDPIVWQREGVDSATADPRGDSWYALRIDDYKLVKKKGSNDLTDDKAYFLHDVSVTGQEYANLLNKDAELEIGARMKEVLLEMRLSESRVEGFPEDPAGPVTVLFDPRYDVGSKGMTLHFKLDVIDLENATILYDQPGSQTLELLADGRLHWTITGAQGNNDPVTRELYSDRLSVGQHEITLAVLGYKAGAANISLRVDGVEVDSITPDDVDAILTVWSSHTDITFGSDAVTITDARFHTLNFWEDEVGHIYDEPSLPNHFGTIGADTMIGTNQAEALFGARGDDTLIGRRGADELFGGNGDDKLSGGIGADLIDGGAGFDLANYGSDSAAVIVNLLDPSQNTGAAAGDIYVGIEGVMGTNRFGDTLVGDAQANKLMGLGGRDLIDGGEGDDILIGGAGADIFRFQGDTGHDRITDYRSADGIDARLLGIYALGDFDRAFETASGNAVLWIGDSKIIVSGTGLDAISFVTDEFEITGTSGADDLVGTAYSERIRGLGGDDTINGMDGDDTLLGGSGADIFVLAGSFGYDKIADYEPGALVDATALGITSLDQFDSILDAPGSGNAILWKDDNKLVVANIAAEDIAFVQDSSGATTQALPALEAMAFETAPELAMEGLLDSLLGTGTGSSAYIQPMYSDATAFAAPQLFAFGLAGDDHIWIPDTVG